MASGLSLFFLSCALAAPVQNATVMATIAPCWVPDPQGRGTWGLLHSCVFTLVLCVWTSIHLNVPPPDDTRRAHWFRKIKWLLVALIAPEMVVFTAFQQWFAAKTFLRKLNVIAAETADESNLPGSKSLKLQKPFNMTYAQFVVMGGFVVDISHLHNKFTRATITTDGVLFLASQGHFIHQSTNSIRDKSKADFLAEGLVCIQVLWVCGQAIERKVAGLPVTLLEVHTIVHVIFALVMYALWYQKPLNVQDPLFVNAEAFQAPLAFMVSAMRLDRDNKYAGHLRYFDLYFEGTKSYPSDPYLSWYKHLDLYHLDSCVTVDPGDSFYYSTSQDLSRWDLHAAWFKLPLHGQSDDTVATYSAGIRQATDGSWHACSSEPILHYYLPNATFDSTEPGSIGVVGGQALTCGFGPRNRDVILFSPKDIRRLELTADFVSAKLGNSAPSTEPITLWEKSVQDDFRRPVVAREPNMRDVLFSYLAEHSFLAHDGDNHNWAIIPFVAVMVTVPTAYGCVHLAALRIVFPTPVERLLWKISCYILIGFATGAGLLTVVSEVLQASNLLGFADLIYPLMGEMDLSELWELTSALPVLPLLCVVLYVSARLYIVVESFVSLRHVPVGVFQTPGINFMNYIPHI